MADLIKRASVLDALDEIEQEVQDGDGFQYEKWKTFFQEMPREDAIPLGIEMWMDRFNFMTRGWRDESGEVFKTSFVITKRDGDEG